MGAAQGNDPARKPNTPANLPLPVPWLAAIAGAGTVLVLALALGLVAFIQSPDHVSESEFQRFEHQSRFDYTAAVEPSSLYPDGIVRPPVEADLPDADADDASSSGEEFNEPIYNELLQSFTIDYTYTLASELEAEVEGMIGMDLEIQSGSDGWTRTRELVPSQPFTGTTASLSHDLDVPGIAQDLDTIETETGAISNFYSLRVLPRVDIVGEVGGEDVAEVVTPEFNIEYTARSLRPSAALTDNQATLKTETITSAAQIGPTSVSTARWVAIVGAALATGALLVIAAAIAVQVSRDERKLIQLRYSSMLVPVRHAGRQSVKKATLRVDSIHHLARLAKVNDGIIFEAPEDDDRVRYFVLDGDTAYEYLCGSWSAADVVDAKQGSRTLEA